MGSDVTKLAKITNDQRLIEDALDKFEDIQTVTKAKVDYMEVLEDIQIDEKNLKSMMKESIREYNSGFA